MNEMAPAWHAEAIALNADGLSQREIAEQCGVSQPLVCKYLNRLKRLAAEVAEPEPEIDGRGVHDDSEFIQPHKRRVIRQILVDPRTKRVALEAFARGVIDR